MKKEKIDINLALELNKQLQEILDKWLSVANPKWYIRSHSVKFCEDILKVVNDVYKVNDFSQILQKILPKLRKKFEEYMNWEHSEKRYINFCDYLSEKYAKSKTK